jgi:hypothetical protein
MKLIGMLALAIAVTATAPALAHEKGGRAVGTIETVSPTRIVLRATDGHPVTFSITSSTVFVQGEKPARSEDVRVGQRAVVEGKRSGERLDAVRVKLGTVPKPER